ncbi:transcriptional regulator, AsnC family [Thalassobium sp. R2A62]|nr:transcriptional regulator, AsnC family [Thalassobium sp. R2A62]
MGFCSKFYRMSITYDDIDRRLMVELQRDAGQSVDMLSESAGLSRNAVWRRIKRLEDDGLITGRVATVDPVAVGLGLTVFVSIKTARHDAKWADRFARAVRSFEEVLGLYRTAGDQDYLLRVRVADVVAYDAFYQRLIEQVDLADVSASFVMEEVKETTRLPIR